MLTIPVIVSKEADDFSDFASKHNIHIKRDQIKIGI